MQQGSQIRKVGCCCTLSRSADEGGSLSQLPDAELWLPSVVNAEVGCAVRLMAKFVHTVGVFFCARERQITTTIYYLEDRSKRTLLLVQLVSICMELVVGFATVSVFFRKLVTHHRGTAKELEVLVCVGGVWQLSICELYLVAGVLHCGRGELLKGTELEGLLPDCARTGQTAWRIRRHRSSDAIALASCLLRLVAWHTCCLCAPLLCVALRVGDCHSCLRCAPVPVLCTR